jgi:hypothetical protein
MFNFFGSISVLLSFSTFSLLFYFLTCTFTKYKPFLVFFADRWNGAVTKLKKDIYRENRMSAKTKVQQKTPLILLVHLFLL